MTVALDNKLTRAITYRRRILAYIFIF